MVDNVESATNTGGCAPTRRGLLLVISGPAGSGKGTVVKRILEQPDYGFSVSATTRAPRPGEEHGREYFFLTKEEFRQGIAEEQFLEHAEYCGNYYGTPRAAVEEKLANGINVILEIEVQGALQVKEKDPSALLIMIIPPDFETLAARLRGRGTESEETVLLRLAAAKGELSRLQSYDYLIVNENDGVEKTAAAILETVRAEKRRIARLDGGVDGFIRRFYGESENA